MGFSLDARIPVVFGAAGQTGPRDALLREGVGSPAWGGDWFQPERDIAHLATGCPCCPPRNSAGLALTRLMLTRGRGTGLFFDRVVVAAQTQAGRTAIIRALDQDPIASGFYKAARGED